MFDFTDRVAFITGGASGIGRATAERFAAFGANVVIVDIDGDAAVNAADSIQSATSTEVLGIQADVTESAAVNRAVEQAVDRFGRIDVLFNNAGLSQSQVASIPMQIDELPEAAWDALHAVHLKGAFLCSKYVVPEMRSLDTGVILNTSSKVALRVSPGMGGYSTAKGGLITLTEQLALDLADGHIRVNAICPGPTDTPMFKGEHKSPEWIEQKAAEIPFGRLIDPSDVADAAVFLSSDNAEMLSGVVLPVDGGARLAYS